MKLQIDELTQWQEAVIPDKYDSTFDTLSFFKMECESQSLAAIALFPFSDETFQIVKLQLILQLTHLL